MEACEDSPINLLKLLLLNQAPAHTLAVLLYECLNLSRANTKFRWYWLGLIRLAWQAHLDLAGYSFKDSRSKAFNNQSW